MSIIIAIEVINDVIYAIYNSTAVKLEEQNNGLFFNNKFDSQRVVYLNTSIYLKRLYNFIESIKPGSSRCVYQLIF